MVSTNLRLWGCQLHSLKVLVSETVGSFVHFESALPFSFLQMLLSESPVVFQGLLPWIHESGPPWKVQTSEQSLLWIQSIDYHEILFAYHFNLLKIKEQFYLKISINGNGNQP